VRARALLTRYLSRYPNGTLAEEALAMSIEAANVHRDGDAAALARRYLRLYPAGHFAVLVRQTLDGGGSAPAGN
jgi:outer membrane protein assembly factor BamD (BamD/ComL family)